MNDSLDKAIKVIKEFVRVYDLRNDGKPHKHSDTVDEYDKVIEDTCHYEIEELLKEVK